MIGSDSLTNALDKAAQAFTGAFAKCHRVGLIALMTSCLTISICSGQAPAQGGTGTSEGYKVIGPVGPSYSAGGIITSVIIAGSAVYGTTDGGAASKGGLIFKENLDGTGYQQLYSFSAPNSYPSGLVLSGTTLLGVTNYGPTNDYGSVFKINLDGTGYTTLHDFTTQAAAYPADLAIGNGVVYGTTVTYDGTSGGVLFKVNLDGTGYAALHTFDVNSTYDGYSSSLLISGDILYGTRQYGGTGTYGTVFKVGIDGTGYTTLHNFSGPDGALPSLLVLSGTTLYGNAIAGGSQMPVTNGSGNLVGGTVFKMNLDGAGFSLLHSFTGQSPTGTDCTGLILSGNTLYGSTQFGSLFSKGGIFSIGTDGTGFTDLYNFGTTLYSSANPLTLALAGTTLYGAGQYGGANGQPVLFSLPVAGSTNSWEAKHLAAAPDGTARIEWVRDDGAMILWSVDGNGVQTHQSAVYGPFTDSDGTWRPGQIAVAKDGSLRMLWSRTDYAMGIWSLDTDGNVTKIGPVYGPYQDSSMASSTWEATALAVAQDGSERMLWDRRDGAMGVWTLDANGNQTHVGPIYGPYYDSGFGRWTAYGIGVADDGTSQVSWSRSDNAVGSWTLDALGNATKIGPTYGPYADSGGAWNLIASGAGGDGTSRLFWTRDDGAMGLWSVDASDTASTIGPTYGPYSDANGMWNAEDLSVAPDGTARVLWTRGDRAAGVWSFDANDDQNAIGPVYGPY